MGRRAAAQLPHGGVLENRIVLPGRGKTDHFHLVARMQCIGLLCQHDQALPAIPEIQFARTLKSHHAL